MKVANLYLMFTAACIAGGVYLFHPEFVVQYLDTFVVGFAALAYFLFLRPLLKQKLVVKKSQLIEKDEDNKSE
jgi:hypothetical protein